MITREIQAIGSTPCVLTLKHIEKLTCLAKVEMPPLETTTVAEWPAESKEAVLSPSLRFVLLDQGSQHLINFIYFVK